MTLDSFAEEFSGILARRLADREERWQRDVAEFRIIDTFRLSYDAEYAAAVDQRLGPGWQDRVKLNWNLAVNDEQSA